MKKILLLAAFVLTAQFSMAQDDAFKKDIMKLLEIGGSAAQLDAAKKQVIQMIPEDKQGAFIIEFDATLPAFYEKLTKVYAEVYTHQQVKEIIKFYETPTGKLMASKAGLLTEKSQAAGAEWGAETLQPIIMKYMQ